MPQMEVRYEGPAAFAGLAAHLLREEGLTVSYEPPMEERSGVEVATVVVSFLVGSVASGMTWDVIKAAVTRAREKLGDRAALDSGDEDDS